MANEFRELLIGCGRSRLKKMPSFDGNPNWRNLYLLDRILMREEKFFWCDLNNGHSMPDGRYWRIDSFRSESAGSQDRLDAAVKGIDVLSDTEQLLDRITEERNDAWTFKPNSFDEIHAYEVLEHLGWQGSASEFFRDFSEIWRVLKPGGHLYATVPSRFSPWLWGDPSHTRAILPETLVFLDQSEYARQLDGERPTGMSDFREFYRADFVVKHRHDNREVFEFVLMAVKPSRYQEKKP